MPLRKQKRLGTDQGGSSGSKKLSVIGSTDIHSAIMGVGSFTGDTGPLEIFGSF